MKLALLAALTLGIAACAASAPDATSSTNDELRALMPEEILGEISYGETRTVDLTTTPKFRAFYFYGDKNDQIQITATALDATDPAVWFLDDQFNTIASNNDARPTDTSSLISGRYLPKTGKYFIAFRDIYNAPQAKFAVAVRKLGTLPAECDPDGEGIFDAACTQPLDYDPFDKASCGGSDLGADDAKRLFGGTSGLKPNNASVYYNTRQCVVKPGADPDCSPYVYAFAMDVKLATIKAGADGTNGFVMASDSTRQSFVNFNVTPAALTQVCLDGPFFVGPLSMPTSAKWTASGAGILCTNAFDGLAAHLSITCGRFELPSITIGSGDPSHYTELQPVIYARF
jgi:hypothetical protein